MTKELIECVVKENERLVHLTELIKSLNTLKDIKGEQVKIIKFNHLNRNNYGDTFKKDSSYYNTPSYPKLNLTIKEKNENSINNRSYRSRRSLFS